MREADHISHRAIVTHCGGEKAKLSLMGVDDCHQCHLRSLCKLEDDPTLEVAKDDLQVGDLVSIYLRPSQAFAASFLAYLLPFLLIIAVLVLGTVFGVGDLWLAALSLMTLVPYYLLISFTRTRVKTLINLQVTKL